METIYLSLRAQVAVGTFFMKSPVCKPNYLLSKRCKIIDSISVRSVVCFRLQIAYSPISEEGRPSWPPPVAFLRKLQKNYRNVIVTGTECGVLQLAL